MTVLFTDSWLRTAWLLADKTPERIKCILSLIYVVLNLDQLAPRVADDSRTGCRWGDTLEFNHDWPLGVEAALYCLSCIVEDDFVAKATLPFERDLGSLVKAVVLDGDVTDVEFRCVCLQPEHEHFSSISNGWKPKGDYWPEPIMLSLH